MKNTIKLTIPFSFKGEEYSPSAKIDLGELFLQSFNTEALCQVVAAENNIGNYSYEYEVLHASSLHFSDATGLAENFLTDGSFDIEGFKQSFNEVQILNTLQTIAKKTMGIDDIEEHESLKLALKQAYLTGKNS